MFLTEWKERRCRTEERGRSFRNGQITILQFMKEDKRMRMRKLIVPMVIGVALMLTPFMAMAASVTGSIQGFNCVTQGKVCPIGMEDPVIAVENVFVLLVDAAKGDYYFVPNVDRAVLARHINEQVTINGTVNAKTKSIKATDISVKGKKVWSVDMYDKVYQDIMGGAGPLGPKGGN
jgi:hypothetical protein